MTNEIENAYLDWLCNIVGPNSTMYSNLLEELFQEEFTVKHSRDANRLQDGLDMRYKFALYNDRDYRHADDILSYKPCSVLEMMIGLALRIEETLMCDPAYGNRTGQWFWGMVISLGLNDQSNDNLDKDFVHHVIYKFVNRQYERDGHGGLFTVLKPKKDFRKIEIWEQANEYINRLSPY